MLEICLNYQAFQFNQLIYKNFIMDQLQSIIGATENRRDSAGLVVRGLEVISGGIFICRFVANSWAVSMRAIAAREREYNPISQTAQTGIKRESRAVYQEALGCDLGKTIELDR